MRASKILHLLFVATLALTILPASTWAANIAGLVQFAIGDVSATNAEGNMRPLKKGDAIYEGDAVTTTASSSAQIKMEDGGFIAIRPDSKLQFDQFIYNGKEDGNERGVFSLVKGGLRAITGAIGKTNKKNYKIKTSVATIGVRGTDHEAYFVTDDSALAAAGVYSKVNVGETTLTTNRGTVNVLPNQMAFVGSENDIPKIIPINTHLFTVAVTPTKTISEHKEENNSRQESSNTNGEHAGAHPDSAGSETSARQNGGIESDHRLRGSDSDSLRTDVIDHNALPGASNFGSDGQYMGHSFEPKLDTNSDKLSVPIIMTNPATGSTLNATTQSHEEGGTSTNLTGGSTSHEKH